MRSTRSQNLEPIIAVSDPEMLQLWAERFCVDIGELQQALEEVGCNAERVQEHLTGIPALLH